LKIVLKKYGSIYVKLSVVLNVSKFNVVLTSIVVLDVSLDVALVVTFNVSLDVKFEV
jgi:hypothetical protein